MGAPQASWPCHSKSGMMRPAGTRGTRRRGCVERGGCALSGVDDASVGELWHDPPSVTRASPTCSASWRKDHPMSERIRQIVERVWTENIGIPPEWTGQESSAFFQTEAMRLEERISQLQIDSQQSVIGQWREAHEGRDPDYLSQVGLINTARAQAEEIVLSQELYELIPVDQEEVLDPETGEWDETNWGRLPEGNEAWAVAARRNPDRWQTVFRSDPTEEVETAVETVWPQESLSFQVSMGLLWQARVEDGNPVPAAAAPPRTQPKARRARAGLIGTMHRDVQAYLAQQATAGR